MEHSAVWTGTEMIVWGGQVYDANGIARSLVSGARYSPATDAWTPMTKDNSPTRSSAAAWTGQTLLVLGLAGNLPVYAYSPDTDTEFQITRIARDNGALTFDFPSETGTTYSLWISESFTPDSWARSELPALTGDGNPLQFVLPASTPPSRFFRIQSAK